MGKYIRVSDVGKENVTVYTGEQIADSVRGVGEWLSSGTGAPICSRCSSISRERSRFCKYCGARMKER